MTDLYGNEQIDTPTIQILKSKHDTRTEADNHVKLGTKTYPCLNQKAVVEMLRKIADVVAEAHAENYSFEFTIEEVKKP